MMIVVMVMVMVIVVMMTVTMIVFSIPDKDIELHRTDVRADHA